jgi:hypothetical protein
MGFQSDTGSREIPLRFLSQVYTVPNIHTSILKEIIPQFLSKFACQYPATRQNRQTPITTLLSHQKIVGIPVMVKLLNLNQ